MKRNNRGLTLIELIVVITIIGVVAGLVGLTVGTAVSAKAQSAAASVNILISKCRTGNLSKTSASGKAPCLTLSVEDDKLLARYYENGSLVSTDSFSLSGISVKYEKTDSAEPVVLADGGPSLKLSFDRATGGLNAVDGAYCTSILFDAGRVFTIELIPVTGMHRLV